MRKAQFLTGCFLLPFFVLTHAHGATTNVSAESPAKYSSSMQFYASDKTAQILYQRSGSLLSLNNSRSNVSFLFNETRDNAIVGSVMYDVEPGAISGLTLSFGGKLYAGLLAIENTDIVGMGAGIEAAYRLPSDTLPLHLSAAVNYAPDILTFGQADRIFDWNVRAGLNLTDNINAFLGVRYLQFDTRPGDRELDKRAHLGIRWNLH